MQHDARGSIRALGKDCRAPIARKKDVALGVLRTKMVPGDLKDVELGEVSGRLIPSIEVGCCLTVCA